MNLLSVFSFYGSVYWITKELTSDGNKLFSM